MALTLGDFGYKKRRGDLAVGERPVLIVLATAPGGNPWQHGTQYYADLFFGQSPSLYRNDGSTIKTIRAFFSEMSNNRFTWLATNPPVVEIPLNQSDLAGDLARRGSIILARLQGEQRFDFAPYLKSIGNVNLGIAAIETDLSVVVFDNLSVDAAQSNTCVHSWLGPNRLPRSLTLQVAICGQQSNFATIAHELCHTMAMDSDMPFTESPRILGEDLYQPGSLHDRVTLMGPTIRNSPDLMESFHLDPWHKLLFGWIEPRLVNIHEVTSPLVLSAVGANDPSGCVILYDPRKGPREFFFLEYRTTTFPGSGGFDDRENATPWDGLAIWHVVTDAKLRPLRIPWPPNSPGPNPSTFATVYLEGAPQTAATNTPPGPPGFTRAGSSLWQEGMVTPALRWWDNTSTDLRLSVRTYPRNAVRILVDVHRKRVNLPRSSALVSTKAGRYELVSPGTDNSILHTSSDIFERQVWGPIRSITQPDTLYPGTEPTSLVRANGQVDLFWVGTNRAIWWRTRPPGTREWPSAHGQQITPADVADKTSRIRAVSRHIDHLDVFWARRDGTLASTWMDKYADNGTWANHLFHVAPVRSVASPWGVFALAPNPESLHVFWVSKLDRSLWTRVWRLEGRAPRWLRARSLFPAEDIRRDTAIAGVSVDVNRIDLFWIDQSGDIRHAREDPTWNWLQISTTPASAAPGTDLSLTHLDERQMRLFFVDASGSMQSATYATSASFVGLEIIPVPSSTLLGYTLPTADQGFGHADVAFVQPDYSVGQAFRDDGPFEDGGIAMARSSSTAWQYKPVAQQNTVRRL